MAVNTTMPVRQRSVASVSTLMIALKFLAADSVEQLPVGLGSHRNAAFAPGTDPAVPLIV
jgi:hypothetical protein